MKHWIDNTIVKAQSKVYNLEALGDVDVTFIPHYYNFTFRYCKKQMAFTKDTFGDYQPFQHKIEIYKSMMYFDNPAPPRVMGGRSITMRLTDENYFALMLSRDLSIFSDELGVEKKVFEQTILS